METLEKGTLRISNFQKAFWDDRPKNTPFATFACFCARRTCAHPQPQERGRFLHAFTPNDAPRRHLTVGPISHHAASTGVSDDQPPLPMLSNNARESLRIKPGCSPSRQPPGYQSQKKQSAPNALDQRSLRPRCLPWSVTPTRCSGIHCIGLHCIFQWNPSGKIPKHGLLLLDGFSLRPDLGHSWAIDESPGIS